MLYYGSIYTGALLKYSQLLQETIEKIVAEIVASHSNFYFFV